MLAIALMFLLSTSIVLSQDAKLKPRNGVVTWKGGKGSMNVEVTAGGTLQTKKGDVKAWIENAPHVQLVIPEEMDLTISVEDISDEKCTLLILKPDGKWVAKVKDAKAKEEGPLSLELKSLPAGKYYIWVGTTEKGKEKAKLRINDHSAD
jgi:hypothetical protein